MSAAGRSFVIPLDRFIYWMLTDICNTIFPAVPRVNVAMRIVITLILLMISCRPEAGECVILLHGLARTSGSMDKLARRLENENYRVENIDYPSTEYTVERLSDIAVDGGLNACRNSWPEKIHFVTHSLGGILVRYYLKNHPVKDLGRVVMLGPPNQGSEVVDKLQDFPGFRFVNGPAGLQLGTGNESMPNSLGRADFEVGIIAGTKSINLILSTLIPSTNDGKVSLARAHLEGEAEFKAMPVTHTFMMLDDEVIDNVVSFLKEGKFLKDSPAPKVVSCKNPLLGC